jgi:ADP-ribose pyrophosphatase YjhB (NUDIX family)
MSYTLGMKTLTLAYLVKDDMVCLAMKKRGFGEGNWNGYGGKVEEGESIETAAVREIKEESGVDVNERDLEKVVLVEFFFKDGTHLLVHTYFVRAWSGEPAETEEMFPRWYSYDAIPYDLMWADDIHWFPRALRGEKLQGKVWFQDDPANIEEMEWHVASSL